MKKIKKITCIIMTAIMALACINVTAFAASGTPDANPMAGVEDLPKGIYTIGGFTFTDTNTTPVKTVKGTSMSFTVKWKRASSDAGTGNEKLTIQIIDATTGKALSPKYTSVENGSAATLITPTLTVKYNQKIRIWFDVSTNKSSEANGKLRSAQIITFVSYIN